MNNNLLGEFLDCLASDFQQNINLEMGFHPSILDIVTLREAAERLRTAFESAEFDERQLRREIVRLRELVRDVDPMLNPSYDWNADPKQLTLSTGEVYEAMKHKPFGHIYSPSEHSDTNDIEIAGKMRSPAFLAKFPQD